MTAIILDLDSARRHRDDEVQRLLFELAAFNGVIGNILAEITAAQADLNHGGPAADAAREHGPDLLLRADAASRCRAAITTKLRRLIRRPIPAA